MDIGRECALSPLINNYQPIVSTPIHAPPPPKFSLGSDYAPRHILECQTPNQTTGPFVETCTSLQRILSQVQLKLATVFLQEVEYLQAREQQLDFDEQSLNNKQDQLHTIRTKRKQLETEFSQVKDRLEAAVTHVTKFQSTGIETFSKLFTQWTQLDQQFSEVLAECLGSLGRSRTIVHSRNEDLDHLSNKICTELTERQAHLTDNRSSIGTLRELISALNQLNVQYSAEITVASVDFEIRHRQFVARTQTTKTEWDLHKHWDEVRELEQDKRRLEKELKEQIALLNNITGILGKTTRA